MPLMLLDSASLYFRAFYGVPESMTSPDGMPVNAIRGFLDMLARLVQTRRPTRLLACLDEDWRPAFRVELVPSYKAHRVAPDGGEEVPAALTPQVPVLMEVLDALGIACAGAPDCEADDVIGTAVACDVDAVEVVTGDRDLFQLVRDDPPVRVLYTARGVGKLEVLGPAEVATKYGIPGTAYADFAALRGDPSDGLPGVPGVGEKTAASLIARWHTLAALVAALDEGGSDGFPAGARTKLLAARSYLDIALTVVAVRTDAVLPSYDDTLPSAPADAEALTELSERYSLDSSLSRVLHALNAATSG